MQVKIKKLREDAVIPQYAKHGDAGLDLTCVELSFEKNVIVCHSGIAIEIPNGYVGLLFPRSSICKEDLILTNCVGVIDSGYRGELLCKFKGLHLEYPGDGYKVGDRFAQLIILPYPQIEFVETDELSESERGANGYGSSGKIRIQHPEEKKAQETQTAIDFILRGIERFNESYPNNKFEYKFNPNDSSELLTAMKLFHEHIKTADK